MPALGFLKLRLPVTISFITQEPNRFNGSIKKIMQRRQTEEKVGGREGRGRERERRGRGERQEGEERDRDRGDGEDRGEGER